MKPKFLKFWTKGSALSRCPRYYTQDASEVVDGKIGSADRYVCTVGTTDSLLSYRVSLDGDRVWRVDDQSPGDVIGETIIHLTIIEGAYIVP